MTLQEAVWLMGPVLVEKTADHNLHPAEVCLERAGCHTTPYRKQYTDQAEALAGWTWEALLKAGWLHRSDDGFVRASKGIDT